MTQRNLRGALAGGPVGEGQATAALQIPVACPLCCVTRTGLDCDPYRAEGHVCKRCNVT